MDDIHIETHLPEDQIEQWKAFIQSLSSHSEAYSAHFLTLKSCSFTPVDSSIRAEIEFNESGQQLTEWLQLKVTSGQEIPQFDLIHLVSELLKCCSDAQKDLQGLEVSPGMIFVLTDRKVRLAPFPVEGEAGRGLRDVLRLIASVKSDYEMTTLLDELVEKAEVCSYLELGLWFERNHLRISEKTISSLLKEIEEKRKLLSCAVCKGSLSSNREDYLLDDGRLCCSKDCYDRSDGLEPGEILADYRDPTCLGCGRQRMGAIYSFLCEMHCICGYQCSVKVMKDEDKRLLFGKSCPSCMIYEAKIDKTNSHRPFYDKIEELKGHFMRGDLDSPIELIVLLEQYRVSCLHSLEEGAPWPLCLQPRDLNYSVMLLRCCVCKENTLVPKWKPELMPFWPDAPFLQQCNWKIHAICSQACFEQLATECPVCPNATLVCKGRSTLEIVRRVPAVECKHVENYEETLPYMHCSHESCKNCLFASLDSRLTDTYECQICYTPVSKEAVMRELFS